MDLLGTFIINNIDIIALIISIIGLYFVGIQIKVANKQNRLQSDIVRRENALKMADYFIELIEKELGPCSLILNENKINDVYKGTKFTDFQYFDQAEMRSVLHLELSDMKTIYDNVEENYDALLKGYERATDYHDFDKKEIKILNIYSKYHWNEDEIRSNYTESDIELIIDEMDFYKYKLKRCYKRTQMNLLNKLEYLSMTFNCKIADDRLVYQSLHQEFLYIVRLYYGYIVCLNSKDGKDKYFTNIIKLYNSWSKIDDDLYKKSLKTERNAIIKSEYTTYK